MLLFEVCVCVCLADFMILINETWSRFILQFRHTSYIIGTNHTMAERIEPKVCLAFGEKHTHPRPAEDPANAVLAGAALRISEAGLQRILGLLVKPWGRNRLPLVKLVVAFQNGVLGLQPYLITRAFGGQGPVRKCFGDLDLSPGFF